MTPVVHHDDFSPFPEKIRVALGIKGPALGLTGPRAGARGDR